MAIRRSGLLAMLRGLMMLCVLLAAGFGGRAALASPNATPAPTLRPPLIVVTTLGHVDIAQARLACRSLLATLPVRCEIRGQESATHFQDAWNAERGQLDARTMLEGMFTRRAVDAHVELLLTDLDIYEGERPYVFGLGSLTDRVAVVSTARIGSGSDALDARLIKLVQHEVGHTMGLPHHDDTECVMRTDATVASLDTAPETLCDSCRVTLTRTASILSRPGQTALDHARGHLVRGQLEAARGEANDVIDIADAGLLNELGRSFLRAGAADDAIPFLRLALRRSPNLADAHLNLGIALQQRGRARDLKLAIRHFERAVALRPQWNRVHAHVTRLREGLARAQGPGK